ncbi:MAG: winged helix-turn-helix transcriptional regulator [Candidatus Thorarchaeota archaeon]
MDLLDKKIIMDLIQNCRQPYQSLARKHGVTLNAIKKRVKKLLDDGVIEFTIEPNVAMIDGDWAIAFIETTGAEDRIQFIKQLGENEMVNEVGTLSGSQYIIYAVYLGLEGYSEFNKFLRSLEQVKNIEVHQLLMNRGKKIELSRKQVDVLNCLITDPRMRISKIAECTGHSAKTVRRALNELLEGEGLWFGCRLRLNDAGSVAFLVKIEWDENRMEVQDILGWLGKDFPIEFWIPIIPVAQPILYGVFLVDVARDIGPIIDRVRKAPFVKSAVSLMGGESYSFSDVRRTWLEQIFIESGLESVDN